MHPRGVPDAGPPEAAAVQGEVPLQAPVPFAVLGPVPTACLGVVPLPAGVIPQAAATVVVAAPPPLGVAPAIPVATVRAVAPPVAPGAPAIADVAGVARYVARQPVQLAVAGGAREIPPGDGHAWPLLLPGGAGAAWARYLSPSAIIPEGHAGVAWHAPTVQGVHVRPLGPARRAIGLRVAAGRVPLAGQRARAPLGARHPRPRHGRQARLLTAVPALVGPVDPAILPSHAPGSAAVRASHAWP